MYHRHKEVSHVLSLRYLTSFFFGNVSGACLHDLLGTVAQYEVSTTPKRVFSLEQVPDAHRYLDGAKSFGKVVVVT